MKPHLFAQRSGQQISLPNFRLAYLNFRNAYVIFKSPRHFWDQVGIPENHERANPYKLIPYDLGCILKFVIGTTNDRLMKVIACASNLIKVRTNCLTAGCHLCCLLVKPPISRSQVESALVKTCQLCLFFLQELDDFQQTPGFWANRVLKDEVTAIAQLQARQRKSKSDEFSMGFTFLRKISSRVEPLQWAPRSAGIGQNQKVGLLALDLGIGCTAIKGFHKVPTRFQRKWIASEVPTFLSFKGHPLRSSEKSLAPEDHEAGDEEGQLLSQRFHS